MYQNILIPTDGSGLSDLAVNHGVTLARHLDAKVTFLTVAGVLNTLSEEPEMVVAMPEDLKRFVHTYLTEETDKRLVAARAVAEASNVPCETLCVHDDHPHHAIIETAENQDCDVILMASHGRRGVSSVLLGSETAKVLAHSTVPVLVYR